MNKFILISIIFSKSIFGSEICTLPNEDKIFSLLTLHITSWSTITLSDLSKELAEKTHSQASLNNYLLTRMFGDTNTTCPELSNAAEAIISQSSDIIMLTN